MNVDVYPIWIIQSVSGKVADGWWGVRENVDCPITVNDIIFYESEFNEPVSIRLVYGVLEDGEKNVGMREESDLQMYYPTKGVAKQELTLYLERQESLV